MIYTAKHLHRRTGVDDVIMMTSARLPVRFSETPQIFGQKTQKKTP